MKPWILNDLFRRVYMIEPELIPQRVLDVMRSEECKEWVDDPEVLEQMCRVGEEPPTFHLVGHCDGVKWFDTWEVNRSGKPILGKLIRISNKKGLSVNVHKAPVFMIGVFFGDGNYYKYVLKHLFEEWKHFHPDTKRDEPLPYYLKFEWWACDAPQRCEFKGSQYWAGYCGCERCESIGEWSELSRTVIHAVWNARKRKDKRWGSYTQRIYVPFAATANKFSVRVFL